MDRPSIETKEEAIKALPPNLTRPLLLERSLLLPFSSLTDEEFESYCYLLLKEENPKDRIRQFGKTADLGRDVVHYRSDGSTVLVQCKRYSDKVGLADIQAELAKLVVNIHKGTLNKPDAVHFYAVPGLTAPAMGLIDDQSKWRRVARKALHNHLGHEPPQELLDFAQSWWPDLDVRFKLVPDLPVEEVSRSDQLLLRGQR